MATLTALAAVQPPHAQNAAGPASATQYSTRAANQAPTQAPASSSAQSQTAPQPSPQTPSHQLHFIIVNFDYDFSKTPPCSPRKPKRPCVAQFAIYETTAGTLEKLRIFLFYVPLPAKRNGSVPITFQSPKQIDFVLGWHKLSVGALEDTGKGSHLKLCDSCATWIKVQVGPSPTPSTPAPGASIMPPETPPPASPPSASPTPGP